MFLYLPSRSRMFNLSVAWGIKLDKENNAIKIANNKDVITAIIFNNKLDSEREWSRIVSDIDKGYSTHFIYEDDVRISQIIITNN